MFGIFGVKGRIETLFRIYRDAKQKFPNATEQELLEIVMEEHIPPGKSKQLRKLGMSGKQYLEGVFESTNMPNLDKLVQHMVTLEFPEKYQPFEINLEEIREHNRTGATTPRDKLKQTIEKYNKKIFGQPE